MSEVYSFINPRVQPYSYLKSNLQLDKYTRAKFDILNAHIFNTVVLPGEIVIIGDNSTPSCTTEEAFYMRKASETHIALMTNGMQSDGFLIENHQFLTEILGYSSLGIGTVGGAWSKHLEGIQSTLLDIEAAHNDHLRSRTKQSRDDFYSRRRVLFDKLDSQLKSFGGYGSGMRNQGPIKNMLGISTKSFLHKGIIAGYADTISGVAKASSLIKNGTYLGTGTSIYAACSSGREQECRKAKYTEGGKLATGIGLGMLGGTVGSALAISGCAVAFSPVTFGGSIFVCALVGGGLGGWAGGEYGGRSGEFIGDIIYEYSQ